MQTTLKIPVMFQGVGLHSGQDVRMTVRPAPADHGIRFVRSDAGSGTIPARWDHVVPSRLCTEVQDDQGIRISTIEHLMAALVGTGIHNVLVEVDGPEVPILDGSAAPFVDAFLAAGVERLHAPVRAIEVLKTVEVVLGDAVARLDPADRPVMDFEIDFDDPAIGLQSKRLELANGAVVRELSDSRTFCRRADVDLMHAAGLALGGSYENAVVVDGPVVLTPGGLRHQDEAVRHKMLDAVGDLALAGAPILGRFTGYKSGHAMTNRLLHALMNDPTAFRWVICDAETAARLPGAGVSVADTRHADLTAG